MFERLGTMADAVAAHANFLVAKRINDLMQEIRRHSDAYASFHETEQRRKQAEQALPSSAAHGKGETD